MLKLACLEIVGQACGDAKGPMRIVGDRFARFGIYSHDGNIAVGKDGVLQPQIQLNVAYD